MMPLCILALHLTAERLREMLHYAPETGVFTWRAKVNRIHVGDVAGYIRHGVHGGYRVIRIGGRQYYAGRLAWLYVMGAWPVAEIDHINCDRADDRWCNLREATSAQNAFNRRLRIDNVAAAKGVRWGISCSKWQARITVDGKLCHLGFFNTTE